MKDNADTAWSPSSHVFIFWKESLQNVYGSVSRDQERKYTTSLVSS